MFDKAVHNVYTEWVTTQLATASSVLKETTSAKHDSLLDREIDTFYY